MNTTIVGKPSADKALADATKKAIWHYFDRAIEDNEKIIDFKHLVRESPHISPYAEEVERFFFEIVDIVPSVLRALNKQDTLRIKHIELSNNRQGLKIYFSSEHQIEVTLAAHPYAICTQIKLGAKYLYSLVTEFSSFSLRYQQDLSVEALVRHHIDLLLANERLFTQRLKQFKEEGTV